MVRNVRRRSNRYAKRRKRCARRLAKRMHCSGQKLRTLRMRRGIRPCTNGAVDRQGTAARHESGGWTTSHLSPAIRQCRLCQRGISRVAETSRNLDLRVVMHGRLNRRGTVDRSRVLNAGDSRSSVTSRFLVSPAGEGVAQHCVPMEASLRARGLGSSSRPQNIFTFGWPK